MGKITPARVGDYWGDFPGGPVAKNPPFNAGGTGAIPGQGTKILPAEKRLSLRATTTEAQVLWSLRDATGESMCPNKRPCMMQ